MLKCTIFFKIKQGLVGRDESEIAADFKLLEDKEKRAKEQKNNEIQNKIKAARERKQRVEKLKEVVVLLNFAHSFTMVRITF